ncbi:hypothetical protein BH10PSE6_BH10PSE6_06160 [soil metagenome]
MSLASLPTTGCRTLGVVFAGVVSLVLLAGPALAADAKRAVNLTVQPSAKPVVSVPSGAELVGKLLAEQTGPSDPDVPLPQPNLTLREPVRPLSSPSLYGRQEEGGGVLGLKIPIPADRGAFQSNARYSGYRTGAETPSNAR